LDIILILTGVVFVVFGVVVYAVLVVAGRSDRRLEEMVRGRDRYQ
jgi:HAMP domain-containing protein